MSQHSESEQTQSDLPQTDLSQTDLPQTGRRDFLKTGAAIGAAATIAGIFPVRARAGATNLKIEKLRTAHIGVGGKGRSDLGAIASHKQVEIAALCDVDSNRLAPATKKHPNAKQFADYREMFKAMGDKIDAVVVTTPDHTHAPASLMAMNLGKAIYCQKPLTHGVIESRKMRLLAEKKKLVTQMGVQLHSSAEYRRGVAVIQGGGIGKVSTVYAWSSKKWGYDGAAFQGKDAVPANFNWDCWIGSAAKRDFVKKVYHPGQWRKLLDFGNGTLGDMGVHICDTPFTALELTAPNWVKTTCRQPTGVGHPSKNIVAFEFPGTKYTTKTLSWKWYDGAYAQPKEASAAIGGANLPGQGALFVGEKGCMLLPHIGQPKLFLKKGHTYKVPQIKSENHYHQWVDACLGQGKTSMPFSLAGPLTEALLLGVVANRFPNKKLTWDAKNLKVTNVAAANKLLARDYRAGFKVE